MNPRSVFPSSAAAAVALVFAMAPDAAASSSGAPAFFTGSPASFGNSCAICHADGPGSGSVQLLGAPVSYRPNETYSILVRVADPDQVGAGFELSAEDPAGTHLGTLIISDPTNTQFAEDIPDWVTHTGTGVDNSIADWAAMGNAAEYALQWQAPAADAGPVTFWTAGNAINDGMGNNGDFVYLTNETAVYCPADTNNDGQINVTDLVNVILEWGCTSPPGPCATDTNGDGVVNVLDLLAVILAWGEC